MHRLIEIHREELRTLAQRYGIRSIKVFGSMARDDANEDSDVDLLVETGPETSGFALGALLMDAQDLLGRRVDIVTRTPFTRHYGHGCSKRRARCEGREMKPGVDADRVYPICSNASPASRNTSATTNHASGPPASSRTPWYETLKPWPNRVSVSATRQRTPNPIHPDEPFQASEISSYTTTWASTWT